MTFVADMALSKSTNEHVFGQGEEPREPKVNPHGHGENSRQTVNRAQDQTMNNGALRWQCNPLWHCATIVKLGSKCDVLDLHE